MSTTPRRYSRSRPRDSILEDNEDDDALDAILIELGIPANNEKKKDAPVEVIELITPPRTSPPAKKRKHNDGLLVVDLTTSPCPSLSHPNSDTIVQTVSSVDEEEQEQDEISFSYSPSECPPPFLLAFSPQKSSSSDILSPSLYSATRRQVCTDEKAQIEAKQTRRLSGRLENLHFETTESKTTSTAGITTTATTSVAIATTAESCGARTMTLSTGSKTGRSSSRSRAACGKDATGVVAVVQMEKSLNNSVAGESIRDALKSHVYNGKSVPFTVATALDCTVPGVIRWERRGNGTSYYSCAVYYEASVYLNLLQKKGYMELVDVVQYLRTLVLKAQAEAKEACELQEKEESSKYFIIVEGMDRSLIDLKKRQKYKQGSLLSDKANTNIPMITFADLHEVAFQLFMDVSAHTKFTSDIDSTANYVALLTRELVVASSRVSALEESLESVSRYNSFRVTRTGSTASACANAWLRMLQVIPGVSEDKAQCLLGHFPTFDSLMRAYRDPSLSREQKQDLVADKLHNVRIQRALSKRIYTVFCEENPDALI